MARTSVTREEGQLSSTEERFILQLEKMVLQVAGTLDLHHLQALVLIVIPVCVS